MIDEIDKRILDELSKNSRLTMKKLGGKSTSHCSSNRIKSSKVIRQWHNKRMQY